MSEIRLIMVEDGKATSGHIPSSAIPAVMWAIANGSDNAKTLWARLKEMDPGLEEHYNSNRDNSPLLEGFDDGLLVISWDHCCIESFQVYQPLRFTGTVLPHNGRYMEMDCEEVEYQINRDWSIIDHHFEESRH